ncbi:hypothetical protein UFOVP1146_110 [uncultured Caudovirales phage]|uniref:DUF4407 domain-containing protein n=1 Tax=uncultured Caudovirales phage TaxID=2100421 RepID=A0A6J5P2T0_9CAUD|nr:hypothetical protein UFOVP812_23 [uncultured Caudovirales phage]CAB4165585.1 hypothetical protein UFOVP818_121 [uncultured Caudovirales phage]CAB4186764.1 hypothetical protein UFOVP1146_110 [uncultured Caudovirales phage]CAB4220648.1 hypothetical protein UFOVP1638_34 [uncultured Caudovirales phage]
MFLSYLMLTVALSLSMIAAFYSIMGLAAIFAAAVIPIVVMGSILEVAKLTVTVWLHEHWLRCRILMKMYLTTAVMVLMLITSMGIFGFLSKAHLDQAVPAGDVAARVALFDDKIATEKSNIATSRTALKQMDAAVDQRMARSDDEKGAERAVQIRRSQQAERTRIQKDIDASQKVITKLSEERAPIASELRKVEAEVGPIKYIAAFIYNDKPDEGMLERAVRWVIVTIVFVFDPLAIMMLLAATESLGWKKAELKSVVIDTPVVPEPTIPDVVESPPTQPTEGEKQEAAWLKDEYYDLDEKPKIIETPKSEAILPAISTMVEADKAAMSIVPPEEILGVTTRPFTADEIAILDKPVDDVEEGTPDEKAAERAWKTANPNDTLKHQRALLEQGKIQQLPWITLDNKQGSMVGFGLQFPTAPTRGSMFVRVDRMPTALFKFNGRDWIEIDKNLSDEFSYDAAYVEHLIAKVDSGEYDPELLNDAERAQIALHIGKA